MDSIEKLRVKNNQLLKQLIETHLSFIIEFDLDFSLDQKSDNQKNNKRKATSNLSIFGANLTQEGICSVHQLIDFITSDSNISKEGIFRKSGSALRQMELKELISSGITVDLWANRFTVHDCCSVLKIFLSELPEPLLTESNFEVFRKISYLTPEVMSPNKTYPKKLTAIQLLLLVIPAPNRQLLQELLDLFEKVIQNSETNKMSSSSLATIFAPHLFCPRSFTAIELQKNLNSMTSTLIYMIDNRHVICHPPTQLVKDVDKQLQTIELKKDQLSASSLPVVNASHQFCVQQQSVNNDDYTANQLAQLYAYMQSMPQTGTPQKKKWIKRFNRENGKGTPLLKQKNTDSNKKLKLGNVFRAGQQFLFGNTEEIPKQTKVNKIVFSGTPVVSPLKSDEQIDKQLYKKLTPIRAQNIDQNVENNESVTPISLCLENANKKVRLSVRKVGNREPLVM